MFVYVGMRKSWASKERKQMFISLKPSQGQARYFLLPQERKCCGASILCVYTDSEVEDCSDYGYLHFIFDVNAQNDCF